MTRTWVQALRDFVRRAPENLPPPDLTPDEDAAERAGRLKARLELVPVALAAAGVDRRVLRELRVRPEPQDERERRIVGHVLRGRSVWLHGPTGTFKSTLAGRCLQALLVQRCKRIGASEPLDAGDEPERGIVDFGAGVRWLFAPHWLETVRAGFKSEGDSDAVGEVCSADIVVIDDFGKERVNEWSTEALFRIVHQRQAHGLPLIVTSNLEPDEAIGGDLSKRYGDTGDAMASRIRGACIVTRMSGPDARRA